jgi:hypothetical protein
LPDSDVRLGRLPDLSQVVVKNAEASNDEAVVLAFLPRELG